MRPNSPLNPRQVEVLRWIGDSCPDSIMTGHSHKITARALHGRRLVDISKRNGLWSATLTDAGQYYVKHGDFPSTLPTGKPSQASTQRPKEKPAASEATTRSHAQNEDTAAVGYHVSTARRSQTSRRSPAAQLVTEVVAAGGVLDIVERAGPDTYRMAQLATTANRHGMTPPGTRLVHKVVHEGGHWYGKRHDVFVLEEGAAGTDAPLQPVPVPEEVQRYHTAVVNLRKSGRLEIAPTALKRALRILHAVAKEAERRDFLVAAYQSKPKQGQYGEPTNWHLLFTLGPDTVPLAISEETDRVEHTPTKRELAEQKRHPWTRIPTHDRVPSGRLRIDIGSSNQSDRKSFWADRASWSLDDKLPELLRELTVRADELRLRREAKAKAEEQYRKAVEREEQLAHARAAEAHRKAILDEQLKQWRAARELERFAADVTERIAAAETNDQQDPEAIADAHRWLNWINDRAHRLDPTNTLPAWPQDPDLPAYELAKFMNRVPEPAEMRYQAATY